MYQYDCKDRNFIFFIVRCTVIKISAVLNFVAFFCILTDVSVILMEVVYMYHFDPLCCNDTTT